MWFFDRVKETSSTTGTGTVTLLGAVTGYITFSSVIGTGNYTYYVIEINSLGQWEVGRGTLSSSTTLTRDLVLSSSNGGALVNFSAGTKNVFLTNPADQIEKANEATQRTWFGV